MSPTWSVMRWRHDRSDITKCTRCKKRAHVPLEETTNIKPRQNPSLLHVLLTTSEL
jgi:hypothetical protein